MNKRILFIIFAVLIAVALYYLSEMVADKDVNIKIIPKEINIQESTLEINDKEININYQCNAVVNSFDGENLEVTMFISDINSLISPMFGEIEFHCFMEYDYNGKKVVKPAKVKATFNQDIRNKTAYSLVLDYSGSMFYSYDPKKPYEYLQDAAKSFVDGFSGKDYAEIIKFGSTIDYIQGFSNDKSKLRKAIYAQSSNREGTKLYSASNQALKSLNLLDDSYLKAVVAFSDGADSGLESSEDELIENANRNLTPIFTIGLMSTDFNDAPIKNIAEQTGGLYYYANKPDELSKIYEVVSNNIKNSVVIKAQWEANQVPASGTQVKVLIKGINFNQIVAQWEKLLTIK